MARCLNWSLSLWDTEIIMMWCYCILQSGAKVFTGVSIWKNKFFLCHSSVLLNSAHEFSRLVMFDVFYFCWCTQSHTAQPSPLTEWCKVLLPHRVLEFIRVSGGCGSYALTTPSHQPHLGIPSVSIQSVHVINLGGSVCAFQFFFIRVPLSIQCVHWKRLIVKCSHRLELI